MAELNDKVAPDSAPEAEGSGADAPPANATADPAEALQREKDILQDRLLRTAAEFDNYRKRMDRERRELSEYAAADVLKDLLPILDNFERAVTHARPQDLESDFGQGVLIIRKQLAELWKRYGLIPIDTSGQFDPNLHEAVATEKTDSVPPNTIVEELQKGFFLNDKLIRPAMVKVSVRPGDASDEQ